MARKEIITNSGKDETRLAILEDGQLTEVVLERAQSRGLVGNIYKGRVSRVLPGMQSAFVDIGLERDGFSTSRTYSPTSSNFPAGWRAMKRKMPISPANVAAAVPVKNRGLKIF